MRPPYTVTPEILNELAAVAERVGELRGMRAVAPELRLRKQNLIRTVHSSLAMEGNTLDERAVTALLEGKRVAGPEKDIREVLNAQKVYASVETFDPLSEADFLRSHGMLLAGLAIDAGRYRAGAVAIARGEHIAHIAPPASRVPGLMRELFSYVRTGTDPMLIRAAVFHYELEFIHPFSDGNGRMGRLWHTLLVSREHPVLGHRSFESAIAARSEEYYRVLSDCDRAGESTAFVLFSLRTLRTLLEEVMQEAVPPAGSAGRLDHFAATYDRTLGPFTRARYLAAFRGLSTAAASRDLKWGVEQGRLSAEGRSGRTRYTFRA